MTTTARGASETRFARVVDNLQAELGVGPYRTPGGRPFYPTPLEVDIARVLARHQTTAARIARIIERDPGTVASIVNQRGRYSVQ